MRETIISRQTAAVFYAPTARRRYFSLKAATNAEASARMGKKYPPEREERDEFGRTVDAGYHWRDDERLFQVFTRYRRILHRAARGS